MSNNNSIVKSSVWNLLGGGVPLIVGFLSIPFAIKGLGKEGFGILTIAWVVLGYFGMFDLGFAQATTKYSSQYLAKKEIEKFTSVFWVSLISSFIMGILGCIILLLSTPILVNKLLNIPEILKDDARITFYILSASLPFIISTTSLRGILAATNRFDILNKIQMPSNILTYIIPCFSYFFGFKLSIVISFIVIMRFIIFLICLIYSFKLHPYLRRYKGFDNLIFKSMLGFGGWISLSNLVSPILVYIDRFLIGALISVSSVSFYTAPYELVIRMRLFPNAIMDAVFPKFSSIGNEDTSKLSDLFLKSLKYIVIVMGIIILVFIPFSSEILLVWLGPEFSITSGIILQILAIGIFFNGIATVPFFLLQGIGRPDLPAKIHSLELVLFTLMFFLMINYFGIYGAAITWTCRAIFDFILLFITTYIVNNKLFSGSQFKLILSALLLIIFSVILVYLVFLFFSSIYIKIVFEIVVLIILSVLIWKYTLSDIEHALIRTKLKELI